MHLFSNFIVSITCWPSKSKRHRDMNEFALHDAAGDGDLEKVRQFIEAVPVDSLNKEGQTPLHRAARYGQYEVAALLINSKCDLDIKDLYGDTPVMLASNWGRKDIVDLLLRNGAQVNCVDDCGWTPLHQASYRPGWADIVRLILDNGEADPNAVDQFGGTPLTLAAGRGDEEVAALLVQAGADVNLSGVIKKTALHWAAQGGWTRVIQILLEEKELDINSQDVNGNTPLHLACQDYWPGPETIKHLLEAGADPNVENNQGRTALCEGIRKGYLTHELIRLFVQKGAFLKKSDYEFIFQDSFLKENVLKDVELCAQSIANKFNCQSLPALNSITCFARRLPNVDNFKLGARHIVEVEKMIKCEIERNTFRNVIKVRPISLGALCVLSLITYQSGKK